MDRNPGQVHQYFISKTLADPKHIGTELVYAVILSALLERLGLFAEPATYLDRYYVCVRPDSSLHDLDHIYHCELFNTSFGMKLYHRGVVEEEHSDVSLEGLSQPNLLGEIHAQHLTDTYLNNCRFYLLEPIMPNHI
jgi:hypothetical protein